jgi:hypothetical protein
LVLEIAGMAKTPDVEDPGEDKYFSANRFVLGKNARIAQLVE